VGKKDKENPAVIKTDFQPASIPGNRTGCLFRRKTA
jgi:hypothetical protein